eukprot:357278-Chlamydomonas_euryale.AAC.2
MASCGRQWSPARRCRPPGCELVGGGSSGAAGWRCAADSGARRAGVGPLGVDSWVGARRCRPVGVGPWVCAKLGSAGAKLSFFSTVAGRSSRSTCFGLSQ